MKKQSKIKKLNDSQFILYSKVRDIEKRLLALEELVKRPFGIIKTDGPVTFTPFTNEREKQITPLKAVICNCGRKVWYEEIYANLKYYSLIPSNPHIYCPYCKAKINV
jgi:hypothetical protein